jgi:hypothetical protein
VAEIHEALRLRHPDRPRGRWVYLSELRTGTGFGRNNEQSIDAYAICCWGGEVSRIAYEIKVSRSDYLRELKSPRKRAPALRYSTEFYFAVPKGLVKPEEVPPDCGLIEVWWGDGQLQQRAKIAAPRLDGYPPTWKFLASVARRCSEGLA